MAKKIVVVLIGVPVVAVAPWALWWGRLPSEVATHWGLDGAANGHLSKPVAFALLSGLAVVLAAGAALLTHHEVVAPGDDALVIGGPVLGFVSGVLAGASLGTVVGNLDVSRWQDADLPLGVVGLGLAVGVVAGILLRVPATTHPPRAVGGPSMVIAPGERVAWVGGTRSRALLVVALVAAVGGAALLFAQAPASGVVLIVAVVVAEVSSVRIVIDNAGLRVAAAMGWPSVRIAAARIADVEAIDVDPMRWGGWGYRGSLRLFGRAAWVLRRGEGLKLTLVDGKVFVVTVDHAAEAAAVLRGASAPA